MKNVVIIAAGGRGHRMGQPVCKQFLKLKGISIIARTIRRFQECPAIDGILVGITPGEKEYFKEKILKETGGKKLIGIISGGSERQETVWNCLEALPEKCEIVLVHDGVRPFVSTRLIEQVVKKARDKGAVVPGLPAEETTKLISDGVVVETLDRRNIWLIQTPQGFRKEIILNTYSEARRLGLLGTDDASLVEALGMQVHVIKGEKRNIKITTPTDLVIASVLVEGENSG